MNNGLQRGKEAPGTLERLGMGCSGLLEAARGAKLCNAVGSIGYIEFSAGILVEGVLQRLGSTHVA